MISERINYGRVTWTNIVQPTEADVRELQAAYPFIHPLNLEDVRSRIERSKIDVEDEYLFLVMHFPLWDANSRLTRASEVDIFIGRGFIVTIHDGVLKPLLRLADSCREDQTEQQKLLGKGANHTLHSIIDQLVDYIFPMLRKIDMNVADIEENIFVANMRLILRDIAVVRRDVIALRRIVRHQVPIVEFLERSESPILLEELEDYFGDIADHLYRARDILDENAEIIASLAETADTLASDRINEVMRILTVISVTMLPLTLISSIYGMNIDLPFDDNTNAGLYITVLMIGVTLFLLSYFRYRDWL